MHDDLDPLDNGGVECAHYHITGLSERAARRSRMSIGKVYRRLGFYADCKFT